MTLLAAQKAVAAFGEAARTAWSGSYTLKVQYENRELVDITKQQDPFVTVEMVFQGGQQADLNPHPIVAQYGSVIVTACVKSGGGSQAAAALLDHFIPYFELKNLSAIRTHAAVAHKSIPKAGWELYPLIIPFWFHRVAS